MGEEKAYRDTQNMVLSGWILESHSDTFYEISSCKRPR